jgi:hypothetical protein
MQIKQTSSCCAPAGKTGSSEKDNMRILQNAGIYRAYLPRLYNLTRQRRSFAAYMSAFIADRYGAAHILQPILEGSSQAFFSNGDDESAQHLWAKENGVSPKATLADILLAQIEHHRTEVFYNLDPMRYGSDFVRKLPGCVRRSFAWRAAPSPGADFSAYDGVLCNFPGILEGYRQLGWRAAYFSPAHDNAMDQYAASTDRPVDVLFVGGYTRHHRRRAELLEAVAVLSGEFKLSFHLDNSRMTRLAESPLGRLLPIGQHRRPATIRSIAEDPVFGLDLYAALSKAKIVLNGAIDMAGSDRGNMRCFEAMGCGAVMISDKGDYPAGMVCGENMITYQDPADAVRQIREALQQPTQLQQLANQGHRLMSSTYSKAEQWRAFVSLVDAV